MRDDAERRTTIDCPVPRDATGTWPHHPLKSPEVDGPQETQETQNEDSACFEFFEFLAACSSSASWVGIGVTALVSVEL